MSNNKYTLNFSDAIKLALDGVWVQGENFDVGVVMSYSPLSMYDFTTGEMSSALVTSEMSMQMFRIVNDSCDAMRTHP